MSTAGSDTFAIKLPALRSPHPTLCKLVLRSCQWLTIILTIACGYSPSRFYTTKVLKSSVAKRIIKVDPKNYTFFTLDEITRTIATPTHIIILYNANL